MNVEEHDVPGEIALAIYCAGGKGCLLIVWWADIALSADLAVRKYRWLFSVRTDTGR